MIGGDDFLREQFRGTEGLIYFCALRNNTSKLQLGEVAHILTRDLVEVEDFRNKWDQPEHEVGIYYHTATLKRGTSRRIKQNCHQFIALFGDIDDPKIEVSRDMARALLEQAEYPPTLIVLAISKSNKAACFTSRARTMSTFKCAGSRWRNRWTLIQQQSRFISALAGSSCQGKWISCAVKSTDSAASIS